MNPITKLFNFLKKLTTTSKIALGVIIIAVIITIIVVPILISGKGKNNINKVQNVITTTLPTTTLPTTSVPLPTVPLGGECDKWTSTKLGVTETINPHTQILNGKTIMEWCYVNESTTLPEYPGKEVIYQVDKIQYIPNYFILDYSKMDRTKYPSNTSKVQRMIVGDKYTGNIISRVIREADGSSFIVDRVYNYTC